MSDTPTLGQTPEEVKDAQPGDLRLWSVTTVIGALDKPALVYWSAEETAKAAVAAANSLPTRIAEDGDEETVKWLTGARFRRPRGQRTAAELGTSVHAACEEYALSGIRPEVDAEVLPFLDQFDRWLDQAQPSYQATEVCVYHPGYGYAGQADAFLTIDGVRFLTDYKTSRTSFDKRGYARKPYPESVALQLAAYRYAEMAAVWRPRRMEQMRRRYYLLSEAERAQAVPVPEVDAGLVIQITPEFCTAYPVTISEPVFEAFLHVQESARWVNETSKKVMGQPLEFEGNNA